MLLVSCIIFLLNDLGGCLKFGSLVVFFSWKVACIILFYDMNLAGLWSAFEYDSWWCWRDSYISWNWWWNVWRDCPGMLKFYGFSSVTFFLQIFVYHFYPWAYKRVAPLVAMSVGLELQHYLGANSQINVFLHLLWQSV